LPLSGAALVNRKPTILVWLFAWSHGGPWLQEYQIKEE
jgi:hypothetical protein